ncbi:MAG TPA: YbaK/EbsC family protein [Afifellaceae bacterium]|nr:YbaK/EbsC family protein [Afifellaceae bacterium]
MQELLGPDFKVWEFETPTRTSAEAAAAVGCEVGQIAKSLIFRAGDDSPILVVASGTNRVDESKIARAVGGEIRRADADFVRRATGFAIGGVPPVGHAVQPTVLLDRDLLQYEVIWAAAGTPNAVFQLSPSELRRITGGSFEDVKL